MTGKVVAMWMPILVFFYMTFEHSVVNMFLFPSALMMHGAFSISDYFVWNEIPTVLGNLVGGLVFTGATLYKHARAHGAVTRVSSADGCASAGGGRLERGKRLTDRARTMGRPRRRLTGTSRSIRKN